MIFADTTLVIVSSSVVGSGILVALVQIFRRRKHD